MSNRGDHFGSFFQGVLVGSSAAIAAIAFASGDSVIGALLTVLCLALSFAMGDYLRRL